MSSCGADVLTVELLNEGRGNTVNCIFFLKKKKKKEQHVFICPAVRTKRTKAYMASCGSSASTSNTSVQTKKTLEGLYIPPVLRITH